MEYSGPPPPVLLEFKLSPLGGKGMFFSVPRFQGEEILNEHPQMTLPQYPTPTGNNIQTELMKLSNVHIAMFNRLRPSPFHGINYLVAQFMTNAFLVEAEKTFYLFLKARQFNHSCMPNARWFWDSGDPLDPTSKKFVIELVKDVPAGEEITFAYCDLDLNYAERQAYLPRRWGFLCSCLKCQEGLASEQRDKSLEPHVRKPVGWRGGAEVDHTKEEILLYLEENNETLKDNDRLGRIWLDSQ